MTKEDKKVFEQKKYTKPYLYNYGDLSELTKSNTGGMFTDPGTQPNNMTGVAPDAVEETFEQFDRSSSSDSSGRGGRRGGE